jgi:hypothetical protein
MRTVGSSSLAPAPVAGAAPLMVNHRGEPMVPPARRVLQSQSLPPPAATLFDASGRFHSASRSSASRKRSARKFSAAMEADESDPELLAILYPLKKKQRSDGSFASVDTSASGGSSGASVGFWPPATPFDEHLRDIYEGHADDGLDFFESHGYYDVDEANTVEMFRQNLGLDGDTAGFWVRHAVQDEQEQRTWETATDECVDEGVNPFVGSFVRSASMRVRSSRQPRSKAAAARFSLLDDDGNELHYSDEDSDDYNDDEEQVEDDEDDEDDEDAELERLARELRLKARSLALDADDVAELERDQRALVHAVAVIRSEKAQLQRLLFTAFANGEAVTVSVGAAPALQYPTLRSMASTARSPPPASIPPSVTSLAVDVDALPPYCGNVHVLRDSVPFLLGSGWRKRWFCLDFQEGVVTMFKRSYWKAPRGALDLRGVARIEKMGRADFRVEFLPHSSDCDPAVLMLRAKNPQDADMWVSLLRFARRHVRAAGVATASSGERALVLAKQKTSGHHAGGAAKKQHGQVDMYARILQMSAQQTLRPSLPSSAATARSSLTA